MPYNPSHTIRFVFAATAASLVLFVCAPPATAAPPRLNSLFPAGAQRGQSLSVTASGTFDKWPVQAWVDRPGLSLKAGDKKGELTVTVAIDARPGLYWIRLYNDEGATAPRPFLVGTLPEVTEGESNDDWRKPQQLETSTVVVNGRLDKSGDVDTYSVQLTKGQTLVASVDANRALGSAFDATLEIVSQDGFVLARNDDYHDLDPQIVFTAPADGIYLIRTFGFPATPDSGIRFSGGGEFIYRITCTTGGFIEYTMPLAVPSPGESAANPTVAVFGWNLSDSVSHLPVTPAASGDYALVWHDTLANTTTVSGTQWAAAVEVEPNGADKPQVLQTPVTITGRIDPPRDSDSFQFSAKKAVVLNIRVESRSLGFPLDTVLSVTDTSGKSLAENDDVSNRRDSELAFTAPADGAYRVVVRDLHGHGGDRYVYRLTIATAQPDFSLKVAADSFVGETSKQFEIPVTVERSNGFAGTIEIGASGLPEGISIAPAKSEPKGDSAKSVKLTVAAKQSFSGPIQIVGKSAAEPQLSRAAAAAIANPTATTTTLWLTVRP